eukprot:TRINITY_DN97567_c0_g1_i1.p2 TRINITY_DN97567_c0_g1~~TRINITY_DN97567_c0_g1_i1.p2  ORF type:complete len:111 (-),score=8.19 TRINITY_DN97567_c0_g1_i1:112-444(-)
MEVLPKWPSKVKEIKNRDLFETMEKFKSWYFDGGGLYLSHQSRKMYFDVQEKIKEEIFIGKSSEDEYLDKFIQKNTYENVQNKMSLLRTELTNDLLSRERDRLIQQGFKH